MKTPARFCGSCLAALLLIYSLLGCSSGRTYSNDPLVGNPLVGKWQKEGADYTVEYRPDGTSDVNFPGLTPELKAKAGIGHWEIVAPGRVKFWIEDPNNASYYDYKVEGDTFTSTDKNGNTEVKKRVK